jgi:hypothetical protein
MLYAKLKEPQKKRSFNTLNEIFEYVLFSVYIFYRMKWTDGQMGRQMNPRWMDGGWTERHSWIYKFI